MRPWLAGSSGASALQAEFTVSHWTGVQKCAPDNSDLLILYNGLTLGLKDLSRKVMFAFCVLWPYCSLNFACSEIRSVYCIGI